MQQRARTQPAVVSGPSHLCLGKDPARALDDSSGPKALLQDGGTQISAIFLIQHRKFALTAPPRPGLVMKEAARARRR